jgi:alpha-mannosidase
LEEGKKNQNSQRRQLPSTYSFLQIYPKNIVLSTIKMSEDEKAIIIRFYETEGKKTLAKLRFARKIKSIWLIDLLENDVKRVIDDNGNKKDNFLEIEVEPFKIITLKAKF